LINLVRSAIDALIVGVETQDAHLANKKTWTRKIIVVTDGESPIEIEDWELTVKKMNSLNVGLTVVFVIYFVLVLPTDNS
jgi:ATP-dependent DNA helicase 2 subunit 2